MEQTFIFGHKKPDTDSVCSAISLSYLKNKLGYNTIPMVLGEINHETKFVLNYFKIKVPKYLNDVKLQIKDLNYSKGIYINQYNSLYNVYNYMNNNQITNVPIVDENQKFLGMTSMKDITKDLITNDFETLCTSYNNIVEALAGKELLRFDDKIEGNILVASYKSTTFIENVKIDHNTILIVGDRHSIIEHAIENKVKLIILTGSSRIKEEHLQKARENKVNIIKTNYFSFKVARTIELANYVKNIINNDNIVCFDELEDVNDFSDLANKTRYSYFPVVNKKNQCLGLIKLADLASKNKKKVILVDHNEYEQSVDGLEDAEIIEIIDHHKLGNIGTSLPINFRNMPVGSTNTIIYLMYKENHIEIPKEIAGIMLSGIISDTLLFASPTTTELDKQIGTHLANIAQVNINEFAMEMFKAGSILKGKNYEEILYTDFKTFTISNKKIGVSQISTINVEEFDKASNDYINLIEKIATNNNYHILILLVTDIINNGSYIYYNKAAEDILNNCFEISEIKEGYYLKGVISRKKQIIPPIMDFFDKK